MRRTAADVIRELQYRIARLEGRTAVPRLDGDLQALCDSFLMDLKRLANDARESEPEDSDLLNPYMDGKNIKAFVTSEIEGLLQAIQAIRKKNEKLGR